MNEQINIKIDGNDSKTSRKWKDIKSKEQKKKEEEKQKGHYCEFIQTWFPYLNCFGEFSGRPRNLFWKCENHC